MNNMYTNIYNFPPTKQIWNAAACGVVTVLSYVLATFSHHGAFASEVQEDMNPMIVEHPQDAYVARNEPTTLNCKAIGFPYPTIKWFQNGLPLETSSDDRRIMLPTGQLFFSRVIDRNIGNKTSDVGVYYCMATNPVTKQTAISHSAILDIAVSPTISLIPRSTVVGRGRKISFRCQVTGNPTPAIFWSKENDQAEVSLFSDHDAERFSVSEDGTLVIGSAKKEDSGDYICKAFSKAGVAFARTTLEVKDTNTFHPPIILRGPHNLTLPVGGKALFHCLATGDPAPVINWYRNGKLISLTNHRFAILESGHLQIADVRKTDSGSYTCKASSNNGQVSWSATLSVESDNSLPKKPATLPDIFSFVPPKPIASLATETSVQLSWKGSGFPDSEDSRDFKYFVEYSSPESNEGWVTTHTIVLDRTVNVTDLKPGTTYVFLLRAQDSAGHFSLPSDVSKPVQTKAALDSSDSRIFRIDQIAESLAGQIISLHKPEVLSSTSIRLRWQVNHDDRLIEGIRIKYRRIHSLDGQQLDRPVSKFTLLDVPTSQMAECCQYTLHGLQKFTWYEFKIQPYHAKIDGSESRAVRAQTLEDVPSAPPGEFTANFVNNETLYLTWLSPPRTLVNGKLLGYKIYIIGSDRKSSQEFEVNSSTEALYIHNVENDTIYQVQISAFTRIGEGVRNQIVLASEPAFASSVTGQDQLPDEFWYFVPLVGALGCVISMIFIPFFLYQKRKSDKVNECSKDSFYTACHVARVTDLKSIDFQQYLLRTVIGISSPHNQDDAPETNPDFPTQPEGGRSKHGRSGDAGDNINNDVTTRGVSPRNDVTNDDNTQNDVGVPAAEGCATSRSSPPSSPGSSSIPISFERACSLSGDERSMESPMDSRRSMDSPMDSRRSMDSPADSSIAEFFRESCDLASEVGDHRDMATLYKNVFVHVPRRNMTRASADWEISCRGGGGGGGGNDLRHHRKSFQHPVPPRDYSGFGPAAEEDVCYCSTDDEDELGDYFRADESMNRASYPGRLAHTRREHPQSGKSASCQSRRTRVRRASQTRPKEYKI